MKVFFNNRLFRQLTMANFFSAIGRTLFDLVFILYATQFPNPELAVGIVTIITSLPYFFDFLVGYLADRTPNKFVRLGTIKGIQTVLYLVFALLTLLRGTWFLFALVVGINIAGDILASYSHYLTLSLNQRLVGKEQLADVLGFQNGISNLVALSGKTLGKSLIIVLNHNYFNFGLINSGFYFLSFLIIFLIRRQFEPVALDPTDELESLSKLSIGHFFEETRKNFKILLSSSTISPFIALFIAMNLISSANYSLLMMTLVTDERFIFLNLALTLTLIESSEFIAGLLGSFFPLPIYKEKSLASNVVFELLIYVFYFINLAFIKNSYVLVVLTIILGYLGAISNPKTSALIFNTVPEKNQNSIFSIYSTLVTITVPLGSIIMVSLIRLVKLDHLWLMLLGYAILVTGFAVLIWALGRHQQENPNHF